jgi:transcriptional regulator with XRE-family HTH domain
MTDRKRGRPPGTGGRQFIPRPLVGLRKRREAAGLTQEEAGKRLSVNKSQYGKFEMGVTRLDIHRAAILAKLLGCAIEELF